MGNNNKGTIKVSSFVGLVRGSGGDASVGGLVGTNDGGALFGCCASPAMTGEGSFGGLVSINKQSDTVEPTILYCSWDGSISKGIYDNCFPDNSDNVKIGYVDTPGDWLHTIRFINQTISEAYPDCSWYYEPDPVSYRPILKKKS